MVKYVLNITQNNTTMKKKSSTDKTESSSNILTPTSIFFQVLSYNMDNKTTNSDERLRSLIAVITKCNADIILIQECSRVASEKLFREMNILGYKKHFSPNININPSEVIFSKHVLRSQKILPFNTTKEDKELIVARSDIWSQKKIWFCTTQFDFGISQKRTQIKDLDYMLKQSGVSPDDIVIFGGDTRIHEYQHDLTYPESWFDSWYENGSTQTQYTVDHVTNPFVQPPNKDRFDRVWYKGPVQCESFCLVGQEGPVPSSHYGVLVKFSVSE